MEQKQLDELDESFFAEEFIDEEASSDNLLDELDAKEAMLQKKVTESSVGNSKEDRLKKVVSRKAKETKPAKAAVTKADLKPVLKADLKKEAVLSPSFKPEMSKPFSSPREEIVITSAKSSAPLKAEMKATEKHVLDKKEEKVSSGKVDQKVDLKAEKTVKYVETTPRVDPWAGDKQQEGGLFKELSTWKALTGLAIVLLLFSVFTQGFQFTPVAGSGSELALKDAETKVSQFVNGNLLQPPFVAQVVSSADENGLYRVTLSVAGQTVESFITKDGKLFFPQGFDTSLNLAAEKSKPAEQDSPVADNADLDTAPVADAAPPAEQPAAPANNPAVADRSTVEVALRAKRWLFNPPVVKVKKGDVVVFTIQPENLEFTFVLPAFGVEQKVSGATKIEFSATQAGSFTYSCSSCEEWRGMTGTLVVE